MKRKAGKTGIKADHRNGFGAVHRDHAVLPALEQKDRVHGRRPVFGGAGLCVLVG